ncbi:MAG: ABC transporter substrate-binding protein [Acidimicrobiales bacterium]|jgi:peptide/nickel transport system substrate-binding protein
MKRFIGLRGAASALLAISSVGLFSTAVSSSSASAAGSTFVIGSVNSVQKIDPDIVTNFLDFEALGLIYQTLVQENSNLQIVPDLATSWAFSNGNKTLTLQLRQNVKFDDGSVMTSADVVASLNRAEATATADPSASFIGSVTNIAASGPNTVVLTMGHPDVSVLEGLATVNMAIMPATAITAGTIPTKPDGTGPFEYSSWVPNTSFTMTANPNYWGGAPSLSTVEIETIPTEQSISAALEAGTIQMGLLSQPTVVNTLPKTYQIQKVLDLSYRALQLQDKHGILSNVNARRAIACATNRKQILQDAVFGDGKIVGPVPLGPYATSPISAICATQNLKQAKKYLKMAGKPKGFTFTAITSTDLDSTSAAQAIAMQSELAKVGIKMNIQNLASNAYIQDWLKGDFQAAFAENGADPDPYVMYGRYFGAGADLAVPAGYSSASLQKLLLAGDENSTAAGQTADWKALSTNLTSNAVWIWLFDSNDYAALAPNVKGFSLSPVNTTQLSSLATTSVS